MIFGIKFFFLPKPQISLHTVICYVTWVIAKSPSWSSSRNHFCTHSFLDFLPRNRGLEYGNSILYRGVTLPQKGFSGYDTKPVFVIPLARSTLSSKYLFRRKNVILLVSRRSIKNRNEMCLFKYRKRKTDSFYNPKIWHWIFTSYLVWPTMWLMNSLVLCLAPDDRRNVWLKKKGVISPKYTALIKRRSDKWNLEWPAPALSLLDVRSL